MVMLRLADYTNRETLEVLKALAARAARGELSDVALCFTDRRGAETCVFTGRYRANPALGVNAAFRMGLRFTEMQDELP